MPNISDRGIAMPASPIRKLVPFAEQAAHNGIKILKLNIGQPDIETPEIFFDAIKNVDFKVLEYSHSAGNESYRRKLALYYQNLGLDIAFNNILVTTGGSEALIFGFMSCFNPGDEIIIPEPFYANYNSFAITAGIKIVPITSRIEENFALPSIEQFEALITSKTKAILICNPNNPTGYLYTDSELTQLAALVKKHNLFFFADEVYREFCYGQNVHKSILSFDEIKENAIVIDSISKRYSACGARIGAFVSRNANLVDVALKYAQARLSPPTFEQIGGEAALDVEHSYFEKVNTEYLKRRNVLVNGLNKIEGVYCPNPGGAFYATVKLPIDNSDKFCQWMLEHFNHNGTTVMMAPATGFYATKGLGLNEVRLAYVLKVEDLEKALDCLEKGLSVYPGNTLQNNTIGLNQIVN